jgi:S-formylglutathione hydrolase FrmB
VLWLLHGAHGGADNWLGPNNDVRKLAAGLPAIVVMPDGGRFGMYTDWWNRGDPAWASYHLRRLRRAVERRYRIRAGRRWHAIAGISMGGQGTLRYAAQLPGYFGSAVAFSAAFPDMQSDIAQAGLDGLPGQAVSYASMFGPALGANAAGNSPQALARNYAHTRMYLTSGNGINCPQDPPTSTFALDGATETVINLQQGPFAAAVRAAGADVSEVTTCGVHTFGVWDRAFAAARTWGFFEPAPERPRKWTYRTSAQAGEMWGLRFRFARPPSTVAVFKRSGRVLTAAGRGSVRIRGGRGCDSSGRLPFRHRLPAGCR